MELTPSQPVGITNPIPKNNSVGIEKILGYFLLIIGVLMIVASLFLAFRVLTGVSKPPKVFDLESPLIPLPLSNLQLPEGLELPEGLSLQEQNNQQPQKVKIIPDELLNGMVNIGLYYLLMMFVASTGTKFADIGIKLIKDIKVEVK